MKQGIDLAEQQVLEPAEQQVLEPAERRVLEPAERRVHRLEVWRAVIASALQDWESPWFVFWSFVFLRRGEAAGRPSAPRLARTPSRAAGKPILLFQVAHFPKRVPEPGSERAVACHWHRY